METVLVVDDEEKACENLRKILAHKGYMTYEAHDGQEALDLLAEREVAVVLLDIRMPRMNGIQGLAAIKTAHPDTEVIMITALSELKLAVESMKAGARGYLTKPVDVETLVVEIERALEHRRLSMENRGYREGLERKVEERTAEIQKLYGLLNVSFMKSVRILVDCLELYDPFMGGHSKRVALFSRKLGEALNFNPQRLEDLEIAGFLHDVGTLGIPEKIRNSRMDQLTEEERDLIRQQTILGQKALEPVERFTLPAKYIRSHLERIDGGGFPDGIKDDQIPLEARIISVVNAFDEMRHRRRFEDPDAKPPEDADEYAIEHLRRFAGSRFDATLVERFAGLFEKIILARKNLYTVKLAELAEGMTLGKNLYAANGKLLLRAGHTLSALFVNKIRNYHTHISPIEGDIHIYRS